MTRISSLKTITTDTLIIHPEVTIIKPSMEESIVVKVVDRATNLLQTTYHFQTEQEFHDFVAERIRQGK